MRNSEIVQEIDHELLGHQVKDQATGRVGTLKVVYQYVDALTCRAIRDEAHLRPVDGSGWEWTANPKHLVPTDDQASEGMRRDG